ncbi:MAG: hypothetical protein WBC73_00335 [Phormidesmis sp.]
MFISAFEGAAASTVPAGMAPAAMAAAIPPSGQLPGGDLPTPPPREQVRHLLFGTPKVVHTTIALLHKLGYAEPNDWSPPIATDRPGEVMAILTKRVSVG